MKLISFSEPEITS